MALAALGAIGCSAPAQADLAATTSASTAPASPRSAVPAESPSATGLAATSPPPSASLASPSAPSSAAPAPASASAAPPLPAAPLRILVIGDSHVFGPMGTALDAALRARPGGRVWTYGSCGSSPLTWVKGLETPCGGYEHPDGQPIWKQRDAYRTPALRDLLATVRPDLTLVLLGTNFLCCSSTEGPYIRRLLDTLEAGGTRCVWVGPPEGRARPSVPLLPGPPPTERLYLALEKETEGRCLLLDARKLGVVVKDPMDQVHVGPATAGVWAEKVAEAVGAHLAAPSRAPAPPP